MKKQFLHFPIIFLITLLLMSVVIAQDIPQPTTFDLAWHPTENWLALADTEGLRLIDTMSGAVIRAFSSNTTSIHAIAWSPDGMRLVSGGENGVLEVWNPTSSNPIATLLGHTTLINAVAWNSNGSLLASSSIDFGGHSLRTWDMNTYSPIDERESGFITRIVWSHDSQQIFVTQRNAGGTWSIDAQLLRVSPLVYDIDPELDFDGISIDIHPTLNRIVAGGADGNVYILDLNINHLVTTLYGHTDIVTDVQWSNDGTYIITASTDSTIRLWDSSTGESVRETTQQNALSAVALNPNSTQFAYGGENMGGTSPNIPIEPAMVVSSFELMNMDTGSSIVSINNGDTIDLETLPTQNLVLQPKIYPMVVGSVGFNFNSTLTIDNSSPYTIPFPDTGTYTLTTTPYSGTDGTGIVGSPLTINFTVVDTNVTCDTTVISGDVTGLTISSTITAMAWHPTNNWIALGYEDGTIQVWDVENQVSVQTLSQFFSKSILEVNWSADGNLLGVLGYDNEDTNIVILDITNPTQHTLIDVDEYIASIVLLNTGTSYVLGVSSGLNYSTTIHMWDTSSGNIVTELESGAYSDISVSTNGMFLDLGASSNLSIWDVTQLTYIDVASTENLGPMYLMVNSKWNNTDTQILTGQADGNVILWSFNNSILALETTFQANNSPFGWDESVVRDVAFAAGDTQIAAISADGTIRVWDITGGLLADVQLGNSISAAAFSPSGDILAYAGPDGGVIITVETPSATTCDITGMR